MVMLDHMDDSWHLCEDAVLVWKECIDAAKNLKTWILMCLCYHHWMTLEDTNTLFYPSVVQGSIQMSQKEAERCLCLTENQIWLKFRRWLGIRGFPETQSRIYAISCTENRVCLIADNFSVWSQLSLAQLQCCLVSLILFGISGGVPVLIILFLMFFYEDALMICWWKFSGWTN